MLRVVFLLALALWNSHLPSSAASRPYIRPHARPSQVDSGFSSIHSKIQDGAADLAGELGTTGTAASTAVDGLRTMPSTERLPEAIWPDVKKLSTPTGCPKWMAEYAAYHAQQRGQLQARYAVLVPTSQLIAVKRATLGQMLLCTAVGMHLMLHWSLEFTILDCTIRTDPAPATRHRSSGPCLAAVLVAYKCHGPCNMHVEISRVYC